MAKDRKVEFLTVGEFTSIYQRGRVWYVNYQTDGRQVRRSLNTCSKKEAILRAQGMDIELRNGGVTNNVAEATIGDVIRAFLEAAIAEDRAVKTVVKYRYVCTLIGKLAIERNIQRPAQLNAQFADVHARGGRRVPVVSGPVQRRRQRQQPRDAGRRGGERMRPAPLAGSASRGDAVQHSFQHTGRNASNDQEATQTPPTT